MARRLDEASNATMPYRPIKEERRSIQERKLLHHDPTDAIDQFELYNYSLRPEIYEATKAGRPATRVIDLEPGNYYNKLEVNIRIIDLDHAPQYEAIFYTWKETAYSRAHTETLNEEANSAQPNPTDLQFAVYCGQEYLPIKAGLRDALRRLRDESEIRTYWVDQICIDQSNHLERSWQVSLMRLIYSRAKRTIVWIGEEDDDSRTVIGFDRTLVQAYKIDPQTFFIRLNKGEDLRITSLDSSVWQAFSRFSGRPVFGRVWIIQKIVVATAVTVQCGNESLTWDELCIGSIFLINPSTINTVLRDHGVNAGHLIEARMSDSHGQITLTNSIRTAFQNNLRSSLTIHLYLTLAFEATDPRDKVYALLGFCSAESDNTVLRVKYEGSIQQTLIDTTKFILVTEQSLAICGFNRTISKKCIPDLPSWVPDLVTTLPISHTFAFSRPGPPSTYLAASDSNPLIIWPYDSHPSLLLTSASVVGRIARISTRVFSTALDDLGPTLGEWVILAMRCGPQYSNGELMTDVFWRSCIGDASLKLR